MNRLMHPIGPGGELSCEGSIMVCKAKCEQVPVSNSLSFLHSLSCFRSDSLLPERRLSLGGSGVPVVHGPSLRDPSLRLYHQRSEGERENEQENIEEKECEERVSIIGREERRLSHASNGDMDCA